MKTRCAATDWRLCLEGTAKFEVIAHCPDGEDALERMRQLRPDVAVVDLNLPRLHGIELVRRVRGEALGTKMVILAGTTDDDIIREVVRAGADAYLLKNGPARHLIDAISYVRDGGQYFSPQLRRDGMTGAFWKRRPAFRRPSAHRAPPKRKRKPTERSNRRMAARAAWRGTRVMAGRNGPRAGRRNRAVCANACARNRRGEISWNATTRSST